jgi:hypothetical protein
MHCFVDCHKGSYPCRCLHYAYLCQMRLVLQASQLSDHGISPGDPMEEGWVADAENDRRARHWRSDAINYRYAGESLMHSWTATMAGTMRHKRTESGGGGGSGGGGDGNGSNRVFVSAGDGDFPVALVAVYSIIITVLLHAWYTLHLVVEKPEIISKKVDRVMDYLSKKKAEWQRKRNAVTAVPRTRYRTLTVSLQGRPALARCGLFLS